MSGSQISNGRGHRVVITGGAGFLGSHMCEYLLERNFEVVCVDNLLTSSHRNIDSLTADPRFSFVLHDIAQPLEIQGPVEYVMHLASPASPRDYMQYPIETLLAGSSGTRWALEIAKENGAVLLLASTSEVYGDPEVNPQAESYWGRVNPVGPRSVYDEAKRFAEAMTMAYHRKHGMDVRIARLFNVYGPRMRLNDGRVLPAFMSQALSNEPLTIYGNGSQTRSFCYVDDMVEGLSRLMTCSISKFGGNGRSSGVQLPIVNLGNPEEVTVLQLAREVVETTGSFSDISFEPLPEDDPKLRRPDITKAQTLLQWEPTVPRAEGLRKVTPYFRAALAGEPEADKVTVHG
ncbi:MAG: UDP-glucuronic acid decarboxylase family protein [Dehalococcoidia bacterium]